MRLPAPGFMRAAQQPGSPIVLRTGTPLTPGAAPGGRSGAPAGAAAAPTAQQFGAFPAAPQPSYGPAPAAPRLTTSGFGAAAAAFGARPPAAAPGQPRAVGISPATGPSRGMAAPPPGACCLRGCSPSPYVLTPLQLHGLDVARQMQAKCNRDLLPTSKPVAVAVRHAASYHSRKHACRSSQRTASGLSARFHTQRLCATAAARIRATTASSDGPTFECRGQLQRSAAACWVRPSADWRATGVRRATAASRAAVWRAATSARCEWLRTDCSGATQANPVLLSSHPS